MEEKDLLNIFQTEIYSRIDTIEKLLFRFKEELKNDIRCNIVKSLYLEFHSIKGAAHIADAYEIESISMVASNLLKSVQPNNITLISDNIFILSRVNNTLKDMLKVFLKETNDKSPDFFDLLKQIKRIKEKL